RPRAVNVTLVRIDGGRIEHHHVRDVSDPASEKPAKGVGALDRSESLLAGKRILSVTPEAEMNVTTRARLSRGEFGHEGNAHPCRIRQFLHALLEDDMTVRHFERLRVTHVDFVLARTPFAFRVFDRDARAFEMTPNGRMEVFGARALQDVIVLQIPAARRKIAVIPFVCLAI